MHILKYLKDPAGANSANNALSVEYRLLSSGTLHHTMDGDWEKSDVARVLLSEPFKLFVVSRPITEYPCELALRFTVPLEYTEKDGLVHFTSQQYFDEEVVKDVTALLCVLTRRLITVAGKVSERHRDHPHLLFGNEPAPMPAAMTMQRVFWRPHPIGVLTRSDGEQTVEDCNPPPKAISALTLTKLLLGLPHLEHAESLLAAPRLYAVALELIHDRPDIAYQLLISCVETMANGVYADYAPTMDDMRTLHRKLHERAINLKLGASVADQLVIEACKREFWAGRKFRKFLVEYVQASECLQPDELFRPLPTSRPDTEDFERILKESMRPDRRPRMRGAPFHPRRGSPGGRSSPRVSSKRCSTLRVRSLRSSGSSASSTPLCAVIGTRRCSSEPVRQ